MTFRVAGAARATIGARSDQEDAFAIWPPSAGASIGEGARLLAVVADGMGGHAGGEVAARVACDAFVAAFVECGGTVGERLDAALDAGNWAISARAAEDPKLRGMGSTLVAASIDETGLRWASVGDSALLLFRAPDVLRLNADHSLGALLDAEARNKRISADEAARNPHRNALLSALTGKRIEIRDLRSEPYSLRSADWLIVASDGIATLSGDEIGDIVYANRASEPDQMAERLIAAVLAKKDPVQDNTTVIALKIEGDTIPVAEDERPTRILRATDGPSGDGAGGGEAAAMLTGRYGVMLAVGMGLMFLIGWLLRAVLE
ncbi:protein phosphatase 2C domain-containing protein [Hyphomicrobium sp. CS1GBMeth3]|uniref:PP2C family protein-serine/threonine phosphatase n=1 Tax=Hyphomicrobium sp. CS1GBMeth3 TaxID=1892845 RepID=UPI000930F3E8|nr:protein phosphatase 2C domain-containing protein [Hyphomicrobium sp. CS1GBMeth3]